MPVWDCFFINFFTACSSLIAANCIVKFVGFRDLTHSTFSIRCDFLVVVTFFELDVFWAINRHVLLHTAYTHLKSRDESDISVMDIEHRPEHKFDITLDILLPGNIKCYLSGSHVSSQMYILDGEEARLDNFSLLNLKLSKEFGMVEGYAMIKNITDELYYESEGYPLEGRTWFAGLAARF